MKALLVVDKHFWSYHQIALALQAHNTDPDLEIDVMALKGHESHFLSIQKRYDRVLVMGHQMCESSSMRRALDPTRWLTGIHSHHAFDPDLRTRPDKDVPPPIDLIRFLRKFRGVNAVSERLYDLFHFGKEFVLNIAYTPNGVDTDRFKPVEPLSTEGPLRVGVAYTPKHDVRKGCSEFIRPACEKVGAILVEAKARSEQHVLPENMPKWHNTYDIYVCASSSEGFSIAVLEALASGRPVISTRVGGSTESITDLANGFLVDRTVDAIAEKLDWFDKNRYALTAMGQQARFLAERDWSWAKRAPAWLEFIKA